jgi:hypothetical protein
MPRALTSAHPQSSVTSPPQVTPPRQSHPHRSPQLSRARGRSPHTLAPPASSGRPSRTNRDSAQPVGVPKRCAVVQVSLFRTGVAGPTPGPTAAHQAPHASRSTPPVIAVCTHSARRPPQPGMLLSAMHTPGHATGAGRPSRVRMIPLSVRGCEWGSSPLGGSLYSLLNKPIQRWTGARAGEVSEAAAVKARWLGNFCPRQPRPVHRALKRQPACQRKAASRAAQRQ